jgi:hypothetical protein
MARSVHRVTCDSAGRCSPKWPRHRPRARCSREVVREFAAARFLAANLLPRAGRCQRQYAPILTASLSRSETRLSIRSSRKHRLHADHLDLQRVCCRRLSWLRRRLPSCGKRPCDRCRAEHSDELAALHHSITSSARASSVVGTVKPSAWAAFRLTTSSYLVGACTGRSAGFAPLRMRST